MNALFIMLFGRLLRSNLIKSTYFIQKQRLSTSLCRLGGEFEWKDPVNPDEVVNITYITRDGTEKKVKGKVGDNVMYLAHR